jgi:putative hemolysin
MLSFFFAGSETAFISTSRIRFELWLRQKKRSAHRAKKYFAQPELFLSTTLVGNNIANILTSSYATVFLIAYFSNSVAWLIITLTLLTIGEIVPKVLFRTFATSLVLRVTLLIRVFNFILHPVIWLANNTSNTILRILHLQQHHSTLILDKTDIQVLINEARVNGLVDSEEQKIITRVLDFSEKLVREAMIPRTRIHAVEYAMGIAGVYQTISETSVTKIPIFKGSIDNIIGIVFLYDILNKPASFDDVISPVRFIPENKSCHELFKEFRTNQETVAIVIDEYGGTAGIITMEDLMEELFGEIEELSGDDTISIRALNRNTYRIKAEETVEHLQEQLHIDIPIGAYETIGGFVIAQLGHIPKAGEQLDWDAFRITITKADKKKIHHLRLVLKDS